MAARSGKCHLRPIRSFEDASIVRQPTSRMDGTAFKARLRILGRTQVALAAELGVSLRTVHYWASNGPPNEVALLMDMLTVLEQPFGPAASGDATSFPRAVEAELDRLLSVTEPSRHGDFLRIVDSWVGHRKASCALEAEPAGHGSKSGGRAGI